MDLEATSFSRIFPNTQPCSVFFYKVPTIQDLEEFFQDYINIDKKWNQESRKTSPAR